MTVQEWEIVVGVVMSAALAIGPWIVMVHAKLAVVSNQVARLELKMDKIVEGEAERLPLCYQHQGEIRAIQRRVEEHDAQLEDIFQRLREE